MTRLGAVFFLLFVLLPPTIAAASDQAREQRIAAAIAYLRGRDSKPIFLLAHSLGSAMAVDYLRWQANGDVLAGAVLIGLGANPDRPRSGNLAALAQIGLPVLDLYGSDDMASVRDSAAARASAAARNPGYSQQQVVAADHFFHDRDEQLLTIVSQWLERHRTQ